MPTPINPPVDPTVLGDSGTWGTKLNAALDTLYANDQALQATADAALPLAGGTLTGTVTSHTTAAARVDKGSVSGSVAFDLTTANCFTLTVSGAATMTAPTGSVAGSVMNWMVWRVTNGGAFTITWNSAYKFPGGVTPVLTASGKDDLAFLSWDNGATWELVGIQKAVS